MTTMIEIPTTKPTIIMTRLYIVPRELVWLAMTQPRHLQQWWGGAGSTNTLYHMNLRPGGLWSQLTQFSDGSEQLFSFMFVGVDAPRQLVWQHVDHSTRKEGQPTCRTTLTLDEVGRQTRWTMVVRFDSLQERDTAVATEFTKPLEAGFDKLAAYLHLMPRKPIIEIADAPSVAADDTA